MRILQLLKIHNPKEETTLQLVADRLIDLKSKSNHIPKIDPIVQANLDDTLRIIQTQHTDEAILGIQNYLLSAEDSKSDIANQIIVKAPMFSGLMEKRFKESTQGMQDPKKVI